MKRITLSALFILLVFSASALATGKPDFSGTWVLDMAKSDMGQARPGNAAAQKVTLVIKQTPALFATTRKVGERAETTTEKLDGSVSVNKSPSGQDIKSTSHWEGASFVTNSTMASPGGTTESTFTRSLSPDGKILTIDTVMKMSNGGTKKMKLIYNRE